jgi:uncharacterized membrane protein
VHRLLPAALTGAAVAWVALLLVAPVMPRESAIVYELGGRVCHQRPERSFHLGGVQLPVCARCLGLYASGAAAAVAAWLVTLRSGGVPGSRGARLLFALAAAPTVATVALEWLGLISPANLTRAVASLPLGGAAGFLFVRMLLAEARPRTERSASAAK